MRSGAGGYTHPEYAASLAEWGEPVTLPRSGGSLLRRPIPRTARHDAMGPYPLLDCLDWGALASDLGELDGNLVAVSAVIDPLAGWTPADLDTAFPALRRPFKEHLIADLRDEPARAWSNHHRRNVARSRQAVEVERPADPSSVLDDWVALYGELVRRHGIRGVAAFSRRAFAAQLSVPGMVVFRAVEAGSTVAATLWYLTGATARYHLGASSPRGYELGASFALFAEALEDFAAAGVQTALLGAGAGVRASQGDGLERFKRGWATGTRTAYLCGRIGDPAAYADLAKSSPDCEYFPGYRLGDFR